MWKMQAPGNVLLTEINAYNVAKAFVNQTFIQLSECFIHFSKTMKRFVFFMITWALVAAVPRHNEAQVSM